MLLVALTLACVPDDVDQTGTPDTSDLDTADTGTDTDESPTGDLSLVGEWRSEGDGLSVLFAGAPFYYDHIDATFRDDSTYEVVAVDQDGVSYDFSGTYLVVEDTSPATIVQSQTVPSSVTAEGIWEVAGDTLTFEVVQTSPDYGFTAPTPEAGFGSTGGNGLEPGVNVQTYVRLP